MIPIYKGREPNELLQYRKLPDSSYGSMRSDVKMAIKRQLLDEQGGLCAYCMSRLPDLDGDYLDNRVTIEHWSPQNPYAGGRSCNPLDYRNMLAVCNGNRGYRHGELTCDAAKGNKSITVCPLSDETLVGIYYTAGGKIHSSNAEIEEDLTVTLNLNCEAVSLPENRRAALHAMRRDITKKCSGKQKTRTYMKTLLTRYEADAIKNTPYVGILIYW